MTLKSFKNLFGLLILFFIITPLNSEEKIDIWKNKKDKSIKEQKVTDPKNETNKIILNSERKIDSNQAIKIED